MTVKRQLRGRQSVVLNVVLSERRTKVTLHPLERIRGLEIGSGAGSEEHKHHPFPGWQNASIHTGQKGSDST